MVLAKRYVEGMPEASKTQLMDLIAAPGQDDIEPTRAVSGRQQLYPDVCVVIKLRYIRGLCGDSQYLPMSTLLAGVKAGQLHQGHFNANQYNYLEVSANTVPFLLSSCNS